MQKEALKHSIGRDWRAALEPELQKLKPSDRALLGEVAAVVVRSDKYLGRPAEDCDSEECYFIMYPSKEGVVCSKDVGTLSNAGSENKIVSFNYFVEQVLEFNFTYLQMLYTDGIVYETGDFAHLRELINQTVETNEDERFRLSCKLKSVLWGVYSGIIKHTDLEPNKMCNRMFLVLKTYQVLRTVANEHRLVINDTLDIQAYIRMKNDIYAENSAGEQAKAELATYNNDYAGFNHFTLQKEDVRLAKIGLKFKAMFKVVDRLLGE